MFKIGFIGCGNMATAIISGIIKNNLVKSQNIYIYDINFEKSQKFCSSISSNFCESIEVLADKVDIIFLAVKPNAAVSVLNKIHVPNKAIVSIVAGFGYDKIKNSLSVNARLLRIMPNTPLLVGSGASAFAEPITLHSDELEFVKNIFSSLGIVCMVDESLIHAVTGLSGSGPAYAYMLIEGMIQAGEQQGLPYDLSLKLAAQTVMGAAQMVLNSEKTPEQLRIDVCSPGGTTLEAVSVFQNAGLLNIISDAVKAATEKSKVL